jgi:precorrin-6Y C5,15-methyltransferase (decarboxylating)
VHEDGLDGLGREARALVAGAEVLVGGERLLAMVPADGRERLPAPKPITALIPAIRARRGRRVCVLASGDPMSFGFGGLIARSFAEGEWRILAAPSSFSLACARMGWPVAETECLSVHNRPVATLVPFLYPGARLAVLARDHTTPAALAALLVRQGFGASRITVLERMAGAAERRLEGRAADWANPEVADLHTLAVECVAGPAAVVLPRAPGLPDALFRSDGLLTKREARVLTVSALAPLPGQVLWDVGAGCGSIGLEWLRAAGPRARAYAIERDPTRCGFILDNREALGADRLELVTGAAPEALAGLPAPERIFIGGGLTVPGVFEACWQALAPGGRLAANAVTLDAEAALLTLHARHGGDLTRLSVARAAPLGGMMGWTPQRPLTLWTAEK